MQGDSDKRIDLMKVVYKAFPLSVGYVAAVVLILMGVSFGSVVIALKAVLSIGLTLSIVYGLTTAVYQNGLFAGLHTAALASSGGLCWIPPVLCFSLLVGLGLDYHIFLLNRVMEYVTLMTHRRDIDDSSTFVFFLGVNSMYTDSGTLDILEKGVPAVLPSAFLSGSVASYLICADVRLYIPMTHRIPKGTGCEASPTGRRLCLG